MTTVQTNQYVYFASLFPLVFVCKFNRLAQEKSLFYTFELIYPPNITEEYGDRIMLNPEPFNVSSS